MNDRNGRYPRALSDTEKHLLRFVLPEESPGYQKYREKVDRMSVLAQGRRGPGHLVLGVPPATPDHGSPLTPVVAFGMVNAGAGRYSVTVREEEGSQIDVELMAHPLSDGSGPSWTYSSWRPGLPSPDSGTAVREVMLTADDTLVIAQGDRRIWLHSTVTGMNRLIPVTSYHGELMRVERVNGRETAMNPSSLFELVETYPDSSLQEAFFAYNRIHPKIEDRRERTGPGPSRWKRFVARLAGVRHD